MYAYLTGSLTYKSPTHIYLDVNGIGYLLHISLNTFANIESLDKAKIYTHLQVKEDDLQFYGFSTESEKEAFQFLISVSGIGPNTGRVILSYMTVEEMRRAILHEDVAAFHKVKGVGPKTAKRIILDLKDKMAKYALENPLENVNTQSHGNVYDEALSAMMALGFNKNQVEKQLKLLLQNKPEITVVEDVIKQILQQM